MRAGQLRHRLTFEEPIETRDSYGSLTTSWAEYATVWGAIWPISAKEGVSMAQTESVITTRMRVRYRSDITTKMRVNFKDRIFNILQLTNPDERNIMLEMVCAEEID